jgi:hypothetical protein
VSTTLVTHSLDAFIGKNNRPLGEYVRDLTNLEMSLGLHSWKHGKEKMLMSGLREVEVITRSYNTPVDEEFPLGLKAPVRTSVGTTEETILSMEDILRMNAAPLAFLLVATSHAEFGRGALVQGYYSIEQRDYDQLLLSGWDGPGPEEDEYPEDLRTATPASPASTAQQPAHKVVLVKPPKEKSPTLKAIEAAANQSRKSSRRPKKR